MPLSVLDLAPVPAGTSAADALRHSVDLVQRAERLGYTRHWVAEHHNMAGIASSSPPVLIAHLATATETIRVGAGGVMLPNHASLAVAEQFGMLEAFHPGRIDLGLGRAPGTDPATAAALRRVTDLRQNDDFIGQLRDLYAYFQGTHPTITAVPAGGYQPDIWMLGSSDFSAQVAGTNGLPFSFAHHFAAAHTGQALEAYRASFTPSPRLERPFAMIGVPVICAPTEEEARYIARPSSLSFLSLRKGRPTQMVSPAEAARHELSPMDEEIIRSWQTPLVVGDQEQVVAGLEELVERYRVDELMLTTMVHDHEHRLRSYELVMDAWTR